MEGVNVFVSLDKGILHDIICILVYDYHFSHHPVDPFLVGLHEHAKALFSGFGVFN